MTTYGYTIVYVEDVEKTLSFYVHAFGLTQKFITPEKDYGELDTGSTVLAFASYQLAEANSISIKKFEKGSTSFPFEVAFVVDDIESAWKRAVAAGAEVVQEPTQKPWGQTVAYVRDCNGLLVEICTKVGIE